MVSVTAGVTLWYVSGRVSIIHFCILSSQQQQQQDLCESRLTHGKDNVCELCRGAALAFLALSSEARRRPQAQRWMMSTLRDDNSTLLVVKELVVVCSFVPRTHLPRKIHTTRPPLVLLCWLYNTVFSV